MSWFEPAVSEIKATRARLDALERRLNALESHERTFALALLDYLRADLAATWMESARKLETLLESRLK